MPSKDIRRGPWPYRWAGISLLYLAFGSACAQTVGASSALAVTETSSNEVLNLSRAWRLALENDHVYRAAISEQAAAQTERAQGRAGLLPQIQAAYHRSRITGHGTQPNAQGQHIGSRLSYNSYNAYVQLQQPILNYARYADYRRGKARADKGAAVFTAKRQETGIRLVTTYFNALLAYDNHVLQRALTSSLQSQVAAVQARHRQHEATQIDVHETVARLAIARADLIDANDQWAVALRELQALVGAAPTHMVVLRDDFPLPPLAPATLDEWLDNALANNAEIQSARVAVRVADTDVDVAASRHLPTTDLVATYGKTNSDNLSSINQTTKTFSVGIQVSIPLFSGGYTRASVARARSDRLRLQHELRATIERTQAEVTRQYTHVQAGAEHINALRVAVASGEVSLRSAQKGFAMGVSSNLEVLKVQDRLYQTKYELARAHLEYLLARLKLTATAGELSASTFDEINTTYLDKVIPLTSKRPDNRTLAAHSEK